MDFSKHYFKDSNQIDEKITAGNVTKAAAKGIGRGIANAFRGMTGRMKTMAFEPGWLKILKPVDQKTYEKTLNDYATWKNKKTKLGPKQNYSVVDMREGVLGDFTGDELIDVLSKYDSNMKKVNMDAEIGPVITIYILNNKGKLITLNLPVGDDGKKRYFAIGLDNKAEKAFSLIHGKRFQDYSLTGSDEAEKEQEKKPNITKIEITKNDFQKLAPQRLVASNNSFSLFDLFNEEVLSEKEVKFLVYSNGKFKTAELQNDKLITGAVIDVDKVNTKNYDYQVLDKDKNEDEEGQKKFDELTGKTPSVQSEPEDSTSSTNDNTEPEDTSTSDDTDADDTDAEDTATTNDSDDNFGKLHSDIKNEMDVEESEPTQIKPTDKVKFGWRYLLKNKGVIFVYQGKDNKYYIGFNDKGKEIVNKYDLINKYKLEKTDETPE